jgi:hypothetical protein
MLRQRPEKYLSENSATLASNEFASLQLDDNQYSRQSDPANTGIYLNTTSAYGSQTNQSPIINVYPASPIEGALRRNSAYYLKPTPQGFFPDPINKVSVKSEDSMHFQTQLQSPAPSPDGGGSFPGINFDKVKMDQRETNNKRPSIAPIYPPSVIPRGLGNNTERAHSRSPSGGDVSPSDIMLPQDRRKSSTIKIKRERDVEKSDSGKYVCNHTECRGKSQDQISFERKCEWK